MKKTYIIPEALTVELGTLQMMAESMVINTNGTGSDDDTITGSEQILTKENKDVNLWDEEW